MTGNSVIIPTTTNMMITISVTFPKTYRAGGFQAGHTNTQPTSNQRDQEPCQRERTSGFSKQRVQIKEVEVGQAKWATQEEHTGGA